MSKRLCWNTSRPGFTAARREPKNVAKHRKPSTRPLIPIVGTGVAGAAMVGTGLFVNFTGAQPVRQVALTTLECSIGDALCASTGGLIGSAASGSTPSASVTASATGDVPGFFVGNGTATHPNAGLLIGDGYSYTADDVGQSGTYCTTGNPCDGGNAGLLFGNGGNGYNGGNGGDAYFYGRGGNLSLIHI